MIDAARRNFFGKELERNGMKKKRIAILLLFLLVGVCLSAWILQCSREAQCYSENLVPLEEVKEELSFGIYEKMDWDAFFSPYHKEYLTGEMLSQLLTELGVTDYIEMANMNRRHVVEREEWNVIYGQMLDLLDMERIVTMENILILDVIEAENGDILVTNQGDYITHLPQNFFSRWQGYTAYCIGERCIGIYGICEEELYVQNTYLTEASEDEMPQEVNEDLKEFLAKEAKEEGKELPADGYTVKTMKAGQVLQDPGQGCVYVTFEVQYPKITIDSDSQTADKINAVIEAEILSRLGSLSEYEEWAKEEYTLREEIAKEQGEDILWQPYVAEVSYEVKRADDKILSLLLLDFNYLGGAHGGHGYTGLTFDMRTGEKLSLETIGESEQAVRDEVEPLLLQQAEQMQAAVEKGEGEIGLFEEYAEYMPDVLTDDTWYLTQDGMEVVANEYLIAPYAAGAITFEIPYEQAAFLKEQYLP